MFEPPRCFSPRALVISACGSCESGPPLGAGRGGGAIPDDSSEREPRARHGRNPPAGLQSRRFPRGGATGTGVTDTTIKIGVISDKSGVVAVPTAGIDGSVDAFVQFCNSLGGIHGRKLVLVHVRLEDLQRG